LRPLEFIDAYGLVGTACALRVALAEDPDLPVYAPLNEAVSSHLSAMGFRDFLSGVGRSSALPAEPAFDTSGVVAIEAGSKQRRQSRRCRACSLR
jgi:hypothetical protein